MNQIKSARRQAYRYGQQVRELTGSGQEVNADRIETAFQTFIAQFSSVDHEITKRWLEDEYRRGVENLNPLTVLTPTM
jgi:hypothetical protein